MPEGFVIAFFAIPARDCVRLAAVGLSTATSEGTTPLRNMHTAAAA